MKQGNSVCLFSRHFGSVPNIWSVQPHLFYLAVALFPFPDCVILPKYLTLDEGITDTTHLSCYVLKDNCCKIKHSTVCIIHLVLPCLAWRNPRNFPHKSHVVQVTRFTLALTLPSGRIQFEFDYKICTCQHLKRIHDSHGC